jgi:hypothetical protein
VRGLPENPSPAEVENHFRGLLAEEGFIQPDAVEHDTVARELTFIWHKHKLAIVIELSDEGPVDVRQGSLPPAPV